MSKKKKPEPESLVRQARSEEEILAMAEKIKAKNFKSVDDMPIRSPEQSRDYLKECGYANLPEAQPKN